ncbi:hypothetical protein ACFP2T_16330 [Plantactinospora solaniradicis]|uniref:Transcription factor WhiB n=1 Tax=Plantactinospora solaniradicis TaxID=1723736 RepID=A0ABW1K9V0_9ACTN
MSAAILARGLTAVVIDTRPCARWDPRMWETGNPGNAEAAEMCGWCPFRPTCPADNPNPRGMVVAGVAYDDYGHPTALGAAPDELPAVVLATRAPRPSDYGDEIMRRHDNGATWAQIAIVLRLSAEAVKAYGRRQLAARARQQVAA